MLCWNVLIICLVIYYLIEQVRGAPHLRDSQFSGRDGATCVMVPGLRRYHLHGSRAKKIPLQATAGGAYPLERSQLSILRITGSRSSSASVTPTRCGPNHKPPRPPLTSARTASSFLICGSTCTRRTTTGPLVSTSRTLGRSGRSTSRSGACDPPGPHPACFPSRHAGIEGGTTCHLPGYRSWKIPLAWFPAMDDTTRMVPSHG